MSEIGIVLKNKGDMVEVVMKRQEACAKCRACVGLSEEDMLITAHNECNAKAGDSVLITMETVDFLKAVIIMYGIPFICMLAGFLSGYAICGFLGLYHIQDITSFAVGLFFVVISYFFIKKREHHWAQTTKKPVAYEITTQTSNTDGKCNI